MADTIFRQLLDKYLTHSLSSSEREELYNLLRNEEYTAELQQHMDEQAAAGIIDIEEDLQLRTLIFQRIQQKKNEAAVISLQTKNKLSLGSRLRIKRIAVAASIIIALATIGYFVIPNRTEEPPTAQSQDQRFKNDVNPGGYKARLTLADGTVVVLDSVVNGELAKQGGTVVLNKDGQLVYDVQHTTKDVLYNTLSTAKGEIYTTTLSDGSKIWLNSASSIRFPVSFTGSERRVEITGEAYFEVAKDPAKKFIVTGNGITTEVLGTHFNVNTYADEATSKVTLLEGSVRINNSVTIKPGQQAQVAGSISVNSNVNVDEVMAWKNGFFQFNSSSIESVMRQIMRWYDVEVAFEGKVTEKLGGEIPRNVPLSSLLKMLERTGLVEFRIEGKKVTVMPKKN